MAIKLCAVVPLTLGEFALLIFRDLAPPDRLGNTGTSRPGTLESTRESGSSLESPAKSEIVVDSILLYFQNYFQNTETFIVDKIEKITQHLTLNQQLVEAFLLNQVPMHALLNHPSAAYYHNFVGILHGAQTVRNQQNRAALEVLLDGLLHQMLGFGV